MDAKTYLLVRHEIQDRIGADRERLFSGSPSGAPGVEAFPWWPVVEHWLMDNSGWRTLLSAMATAGAGYALSRLRKSL
jgi:hypothetical protein